MTIYKHGYTVFPNQQAAEDYAMDSVQYVHNRHIEKSFYWVGDIKKKTRKEKNGIRHIIYYNHMYREGTRINIESCSYLEQEI